MDPREHWQHIYQTNQTEEVSWYQARPVISLQFMEELQISKEASIIDIGGGDSTFADHLLEKGYKDITVLDISPLALDKAKQRLGEKAGLIKWITGDITRFNGDRKYDLWHDRAVLHFLTKEQEVEDYFRVASNTVKEKGKIILGTFSVNGPEKCSGLPVQRYSQESLTAKARKFFQKIKCINTEHFTPGNIIQQFIFCSFLKAN